MKEFADFLAGRPPFDGLEADDLARLVARVEVEYFAAGAVVVADNDDRLTHLWVVRAGALEVLDRGQVVDLLGPGDMFGHLWLLADLPPRLQVRAEQESLCLRIPDPRTFLAHPDRLRFSSLEPVARPGRLTHGGGVRVGDRRLTELMRPVVWCAGSDRIRDVADRIGVEATSCALVQAATGLGIVTDHDFRDRVATGQLGIDAPVGGLATVPALTVDEDATQAAGLLRMVEHGVHHLVVIDRSEKPVGVVRAVDLAQAEVRDPLLIRSAIENATSIEQLAQAARLLPATVVELCDNGVAPGHIGALHAAVVDAIVRRVLNLHHSPVLDSVPHSWVLLGSLARREPLPLSDIDTALVWADPAGAAPEVIRAAAWEVLRDLQRCGLTLCANGANAHNPVFARSRSDWMSAAAAWQHDPTQDNALLFSAMIADSRPLTNPPLGCALTERIGSHTRTTQFLRALLDEALGWRPPSGFVREFVVAHSGTHRGQLDLKSGGLAPVVALARWIAIVSGEARGTTPDRLRRGADIGLLTADEAHTLAGGFDDVYTLLMRYEVQAIRSGATPTTYLAPRDLDTLTRRHLRETFRAIALVQDRVNQHWSRRLDG